MEWMVHGRPVAGPSDTQIQVQLKVIQGALRRVSDTRGDLWTLFFTLAERFAERSLDLVGAKYWSRTIPTGTENVRITGAERRMLAGNAFPVQMGQYRGAAQGGPRWSQKGWRMKCTRSQASHTHTHHHDNYQSVPVPNSFRKP